MIYALIVVYNQFCGNSKTIRSINSKKINVIVFDNSTSAFNNKDYCEQHGYKYFGFQKNYGLSYAYNYVLDNVSINKNDYIIILDDDTELTRDYLDEVAERTSRGKADLMLPVVIADGFILSPSNFKQKVGSQIIQSVEQLDRNNFTAINSGMVVRRNVYDIVRYDQGLFLDCIDHDFMKQITKHGFNVEIMDSKINQSYSRNEKPALKSALTRFRIYKKDFKYYCNKYGGMRFYRLSIAKLTIKNVLTYKSLKFL